MEALCILHVLSTVLEFLAAIVNKVVAAMYPSIPSRKASLPITLFNAEVEGENEQYLPAKYTEAKIVPQTSPTITMTNIAMTIVIMMGAITKCRKKSGGDVCNSSVASAQFIRKVMPNSILKILNHSIRLNGIVRVKTNYERSSTYEE